MPRYLFIQRGTPGAAGPKPTPAQMQEMWKAFEAWKDEFKDQIEDMGGKLGPGGRVVRTDGVTDGPFVELKEIVGGYMLVRADSFEQAIEVARGCPGVVSPGSCVEIREIATP